MPITSPLWSSISVRTYGYVHFSRPSISVPNTQSRICWRPRATNSQLPPLFQL